MTAENTYTVTAPDMIVLIHGLWVTENELPGYACLGLFTNVLEKLSEKGYEQRSDRGFGPYTGAKRGREGASQQPVGLSCERFRELFGQFL